MTSRQLLPAALDSDHEMRYRAGACGLELLGIPDRDPHWECTCGQWVFTARPMPNRRTGNNQVEAVRGFEAHVKEAQR